VRAAKLPFRSQTGLRRRRIALLLAALVLAPAAGRGGPAPAPRGVARVILISFDGFRWDFAERAATPTLDRLRERGVHARRLIPSFPTKTFPNHYTIVTGLHPGHHGLVANNIWDPERKALFGLSRRSEVRDGRWYGGEPVWVTAERLGIPTAPMFWPGSEAEIGGVRPTYSVPFQDGMPHDRRVEQLLAWLDLPPAERPRFLTLYFSALDSAAHDFDPEAAPEVAAAIAELDRALGLLVDGLAERGLLNSTHLLVVSDHGMAQIARERAILLDDYVDLAAARVVDWSPVAALWPEPDDLEAIHAALVGAHPHLQVYRRHEIPERYHYRDHPRISPLLAVADEGWMITTRRRWLALPEGWTGGTHGYDPWLPSMAALFVAAGPRLAAGASVPELRSVDVYGLICRLLDLPPAPNDGDPRRLEPLWAPAAPPPPTGPASGLTRFDRPPAR